MADKRNFAHLKNGGREKEAKALTNPTRRKRGRGSPKGHMSIGGEPVSDHVVNNLPKRRRAGLFDFTRRAWYNR